MSLGIQGNAGRPTEALGSRMVLFIGVAGALLALPAIWIYARPVSPAADLYLVSKFLFWVFAAGVIFLPPRWALMSMMLVMQIDVSVPGFLGTSSIGWENAIKALALPILVFWRVAPKGWRNVIWTKSSLLWTAFVCYVALAAMWSPYKLSALKMVGYLLSYFFLFWTFYFAWRRLIDAKVVLLALWVSVALGCLQSFVMGNPMDPWEGRFSSFCWPQAFGPWLVSALAVLLFHEGELRFRKASIVCCLAALVMTGSRLAFIGFIFVLFAIWLQRGAKGTRGFTVASLVKSVSGVVVTLVIVCACILYAAPTNRLRELLLFGSHDYQSATDVGTVAARFMTYEAVASEVSNGTLSRLAFGAGTATGGSIVVENGLTTTVGFTHEDYVDPNRSLNSDLFRAIYEWGLVGLLLGLVLVVRLLRWVWHLAIRERSLPGFALLGLLPMILLGLVEDNILAGASSPIGVGLVLVLAWAFSERRV